MTFIDPDLIDFEPVSANTLIKHFYLTYMILFVTKISRFSKAVPDFKYQKRIQFFFKMIGVANVNGVISDMDKSRISIGIFGHVRYGTVWTKIRWFDIGGPTLEWPSFTCIGWIPWKNDPLRIFFISWSPTDCAKRSDLMQKKPCNTKNLGLYRFHVQALRFIVKIDFSYDHKIQKFFWIEMISNALIYHFFEFFMFFHSVAKIIASSNCWNN